MTSPENPRESLPRRTQAATQRSRWPGWIWGVPIAAVGIVAWLLVRAFAERGVEVSVTFDDGGGMKARDTKVTYHGLEIGKVSKVELTSDHRHILAHLAIDKEVEDELTTGTRFYLEGAQPSFSDASSLKSIISGPSIVMVPGAGASSHHFTGLTGEPPEKFAMTSPYVVRFNGEVGKLKPGAPVLLRGFTVGKVDTVQMSTDAQSGEISTSVRLGLDPTRFHIEGASGTETNPGALLRTTLGKLVEKGLRASLTESPPLIGSEHVELEMVQGVSRAELLTTAGYPEIPAQSGRLEDLPAKLGQLPIKEIGENVRAATEHLKTLTSSPQLTDSLYHLDRTLAELDRTMKTAGPQVAPTMESIRKTTDDLRQTADKIDATAEAARRLLGGSAASPNGNLQQAVHELTGTARAVRTLANFLDQHPESLIRGRDSGVSGESR
jgi:paraquat-inducible protein B